MLANKNKILLFTIYSVISCCLISDNLLAAHPYDAVQANLRRRDGSLVHANWFDLGQTSFTLRWNPTAESLLINTDRNWIPIDRLSKEQVNNVNIIVFKETGMNALSTLQTRSFNTPLSFQAEYLIGFNNEGELVGLPTDMVHPESKQKLLTTIEQIKVNYEKNQPVREMMASAKRTEEAAIQASRAAQAAANQLRIAAAQNTHGINRIANMLFGCGSGW